MDFHNLPLILEVQGPEGSPAIGDGLGAPQEDSSLAGWLAGCLAGWLRLAGWLAGWLSGWLAGLPAWIFMDFH